MLGKLLLSKQRKIYPRLNFYSHNLMMTDHYHKLQTIVWGSWGMTELIVYYWPELTYLSSSPISLFFSFFFSPQTAGRANTYTHSEILITLGRTRQLMPQFKSGERTRHFKGMIHLILKWICKSDQMTYTFFVSPWVICWALDICSKFIKSWVRWICLPETGTLAISGGCFLQHCYGCPTFFARESSWMHGVLVYIRTF